MLHPHISNSSLSVPQHFLLLISIPCTGKKRDRKIGFYMKQNSQKLMPDHEMTFFFLLYAHGTSICMSSFDSLFANSDF